MVKISFIGSSKQILYGIIFESLSWHGACGHQTVVYERWSKKIIKCEIFCIPITNSMLFNLKSSLAAHKIKHTRSELFIHM